MTEGINTMSLNDFVKLGYLQEVNRQFFHPMGMALSVIGDEKGQFQGFGPIWDYRHDLEGIRFGDKIDQDVLQKAQHVKFHKKKMAKERFQRLGYVIQPLKTDEINKENKTVHIVGHLDGYVEGDRVLWSLCGVFHSHQLKEAIDYCRTENDFIMIDIPIGSIRLSEQNPKLEIFANTIYPKLDFVKTDSQSILESFENRKDQKMTLREFIDKQDSI